MKWFTADTHFGHDNYAREGRGFLDAAEHDEYILDLINVVVKPADELYILGDFAWVKPGRYRSRIKCRHVRLILGNHDKKTVSANVFGQTPEVSRIKVNGVRTVLSHYPFIHWDGSHRGWFHLYGHTHATKEAALDAAFPGRRSLDVGLDNALRLFKLYRPFSEVELYDRLIAKPGHDTLDRYKDF